MRVAEETIIRGSKVEELQEAVQRPRELVITPLSELRVAADGKLQLDGQHVYMTAIFAARLAREVGIPAKYTLNSPGDISCDNFNYWLPKSIGAIKVVLVGGVAAGLLPPDFSPLPLTRLVEGLPLGGKGNLSLARFTYDGLGVEIGMTSERLTVEPRKGDIVRAGLSLVTSDLFRSRVEVAGMLYRLVCLNGATVPVPLMTRRLQRTYWQTPEAVIVGLGDLFGRMVAGVGEATNNIKRLAETPVTFETQGVGEEHLGDLLRAGHLSRRFSPDLYMAFGQEEETAYGLYNAVTRLGRDARQRSLRGKYEALGGKMIMEIDDMIGLVVPEEEPVTTGQG